MRRTVRLSMFTEEQMAEYEARKKKKSSFLEIKEILKRLKGGYKKSAYVAYMKLRRTKRKVITRPQYINLVSQFGKRCNLQSARLVFNDMHRRHKPCNHAYNVLLKSYADAGAAEKCRILLEEMRQKYLSPDTMSYSIVVEAFAGRGQTETAIEIYEEMLNSGIEPNFYALNAMMRLYLDLKNYDEVIEFDRQREGRSEARRTTHTYAMLIETYSALGDEKSVWNTYEQMLRDFRAYRACITRIAQEEVEMNRRGEELDLYSRIDASAPERSSNELVISTMSKADLDYDDDDIFDEGNEDYVDDEDADYEDYDDEDDDNEPDSVLSEFGADGDSEAHDSWYENVSLIEDGFVAMVRAVSKDPDVVTHILRDAVESPVELSLSTYGTCLEAFITCGATDQARSLLRLLDDSMPVQSPELLNLKLRAYGALKDADTIGALHEVIREDKTRCDKMTINVLVDAYRQLDGIEQAERALEDMRMMGFKASLGTYNILLEVYADRADIDAAKEIIDRMKKRKLRPNTRSYNLLLLTYSRARNLDGAMDVKDMMEKIPVAKNTQTFEILLGIAVEVGDEEKIEDFVAELEHKELSWSSEIFDLLGKHYAKQNTIEGLAKLVEQLTSVQSPDESLVKPVVQALIDGGHLARAELLIENLQKDYGDMPMYARSLEPLKSLVLQSC
eukprot:Plantae.Rhodophyta-Purpureofilum_apyrenoidigerum.ctg18838.p1 GENE.Plantae.Rhodophyta-Purpureofilum_apyrenoidigerum.ctg18838~~Plantae.Rhodophyta-Purpureofilum_apyrenoidigerum.ctg18838.p1  ORF type:complete len:676 (+),score=170.07 Plantae.Rhodophyta-Purpureofilum_apyrenoidigerum.ctg18838:190-2217(+)